MSLYTCLNLSVLFSVCGIMAEMMRGNKKDKIDVSLSYPACSLFMTSK